MLKTRYVSIKTEFLKHFFVFFSKPEKLSYEVLNGHRRYMLHELSGNPCYKVIFSQNIDTYPSRTVLNSLFPCWIWSEYRQVTYTHYVEFPVSRLDFGQNIDT